MAEEPSTLVLTKKEVTLVTVPLDVFPRALYLDNIDVP